MTWEEAIANAVRVLQAAEAETNLQLMERLENVAALWISIADMVRDREGV